MEYRGERTKLEFVDSSQLMEAIEREMAPTGLRAFPTMAGAARKGKLSLLLVIRNHHCELARCSRHQGADSDHSGSTLNRLENPAADPEATLGRTRLRSVESQVLA